MVDPERPQTIWRMRVACRISKAARAQAHARGRAPTPAHTHMHSPTIAHTDTHTRTELFNIIAFTHQQWSREGALMIRNTYIASLDCIHKRRIAFCAITDSQLTWAILVNKLCLYITKQVCIKGLL